MITADHQASALSDDEGFQIRREPQHERGTERQPAQRRSKAKKRSRRAEAEPLAPMIAADPREQMMIVARNLSAEVQKRPVLAVAAAVGVGFLLGGAISMRLGRAALAAAGRWAMKRIATGV